MKPCGYHGMQDCVFCPEEKIIRITESQFRNAAVSAHHEHPHNSWTALCHLAKSFNLSLGNEPETRDAIW